MKRIYFISITIFALIVVITMSSFVFVSQQDDNQITKDGYVIIRTTEIFGMMPSSMVTIYEDGTVEKSSLKKINPKTMEDNLITIHSKLNELKNKGYELVSMAGGSSDNLISTTYVLKKNLN
ncbi:MAG: hypothetical protein GQ564_17285 [Bacteroidales bacterium]|nr:hypothetical protein [Bacteroidales bacterium]